MLFGHTAAVTCIAPGSAFHESTLLISASENGYWFNEYYLILSEVARIDFLAVYI